MADLSNLTYSSLQTAVGDWLARSDLSAFIPDFITLFEAEANRTLRTREMEMLALLYPSTGVTVTVSSASNNGSGLIRITLASSTPFTPSFTGDEVSVTGITGTTEANNTWLINPISPTIFDLQNSSFSNAYVSGGTATTPSGQAALPSDYLTWRRVTWSGQPNRELEYVQPSILGTYHPVVNAPSGIFDTGFPSMFTIQGGGSTAAGNRGPMLVARPIDTSPLEFHYYQKIPSLASQGSTGTNWLLTAWPDVYLAGAMAEAYVFQKDWDQAGLWKQRRDDQLERITKLDQKTRAPSYVRPDMRGRIP